MSRIIEIEDRWGLPLEQLLKDFADQFFTKAQTSRALGLNISVMCRFIGRMAIDPFGHGLVIRAWVADTGLIFSEEMERLGQSGVSLARAAVQVGYASTSAFVDMLKSRGLRHHFKRPDPLGEWIEKHGCFDPCMFSSAKDCAKQLGFNSSIAMSYQLAKRSLPYPWARNKKPA